MDDGVRVFMEGRQKTDYALASTVGALSMLVWTASRTSARELPYGGSSLLIGLGLLVGLKHPVRRQIYDNLRPIISDASRRLAASGATAPPIESSAADGDLFQGTIVSVPGFRVRSVRARFHLARRGHGCG